MRSPAGSPVIAGSVFAAILLATAFGAGAENWPRFRGSTGLGYSADNRASAAVSGGRIFPRGDTHLYCIRRK